MLVKLFLSCLNVYLASPPWKKRTPVYPAKSIHVHCTTIADALVIQGARTSATMVLTKVAWDVPVSASVLMWPSDAIGWQRSGSTLAQVMAFAWRHQAITWTNVDWSSAKSSDIHIRAISQEMPQPSITKIHLKITYMGQVTKLWLSCYLVLLSIDRKTR